MKFVVTIIATVTIVGAADAHNPGQKVTATTAAVACKSTATLRTLAELMGDRPRFATFWREQKGSGECLPFPSAPR